jgi:hypothetical protein
VSRQCIGVGGECVDGRVADEVEICCCFDIVVVVVVCGVCGEDTGSGVCGVEACFYALFGFVVLEPG